MSVRKDTGANNHADSQLWCAVINQALADAVGHTIGVYYAPSKASVRQKAVNWFLDGGDDFKEVCALAGMEPERVQEYAKRQIAKAIADQDATGAPPSAKCILIEYNGEILSPRELSQRTGVLETTIIRRHKRGLTGPELWAPTTNNSRAKRYTHDGQSHTVPEWSKITGVPANTIRSRLEAGRTIGEALSTTRFPRHRPKRAHAPRKWRQAARPRPKEYRHHYAGKGQSLAAWAAEYGMNQKTLASRIAQGWTIERALTEPVKHKVFD